VISFRRVEGLVYHSEYVIVSKFLEYEELEATDKQRHLYLKDVVMPDFIIYRLDSPESACTSM